MQIEIENDGDPLDTKGALAPIADSPLSPALTVASLALNFALKYHDSTVIKDGAIYQAMKLEGRNIMPIDLQTVFDTAMQIEAHLMFAGGRISDILFAALSPPEDASQHASDTREGSSASDQTHE